MKTQKRKIKAFLKESLNYSIMLIPVSIILTPYSIPWYWMITLYTLIILAIKIEKYIAELKLISTMRKILGEEEFMKLYDKIMKNYKQQNYEKKV